MAAPAGNALQDIPFAGLAAREHAHRIPLEQALTASDCVTDEDSVKGRAGSRTVLPGAVSSSGLVQHAGRFRPSNISVRTVEVIGGFVFIIKDPSAESVSDGTAHSMGDPWTGAAAIANISGCQLGASYYLATNLPNVPPVRINWDGSGDLDSAYAIESLAQYPTPDKPTKSETLQLHWMKGIDTSLVRFTSTTDPTTPVPCVQQDNTKTGMSAMPADWRAFTKTDNGNDMPDIYAYAAYKLHTDFDASGYDWLVVAVSPHTNGGDNAQGQVDIKIAIESDPTHHGAAGDTHYSPGAYNRIGYIHDTPNPFGSPNYVFCDLRDLPVGVKEKIRYIQMFLSVSSGLFAVYGWMWLPAAPLLPTETYYVDLFNCSTGEMSQLSQGLDVTPGDPVFDQFPDCYITGDDPTSTGQNVDLFGPSWLSQRSFNDTVQPPMSRPQISDVGTSIEIDGTTPLGYPGTLTVRLWKSTENEGIRLVSSTGDPTGGSLPCADPNAKAAGTAYSLVDPGGDGVLAHQLYKAGGTMPPVNCLTAHAQRLVGMGVGTTGNRVIISSYIPTSDTTHPFPQFPAIALEDADGWSFDIAPSPKEQGLVANGDGDAVYLCTNEATYAMTDLTPNSLPYLVLRRGAVGRQAGGYFEDRFQWIAWDGIYQAVGKSDVRELSFEIRRHYHETFIPDCHACIGYNARERALYAFRDDRYVRYHFPLQRWFSGTVSEFIRFCLNWNDQGL